VRATLSLSLSLSFCEDAKEGRRKILAASRRTRDALAALLFPLSLGRDARISAYKYCVSHEERNKRTIGWDRERGTAGAAGSARGAEEGRGEEEEEG